MTARRGFTLPEVLFAMLIGGFILALSIQQVTQYFRLQQVLVVRTELRNEVKTAQERVAQRLRYTEVVYQAEDGYYLVVPHDTCPDGYLCDKDEVEVLWWHLVPDPLHTSHRPLVEHTATIEAFKQPVDATSLARLFEGRILPSRQLAPSLDALEIREVGHRRFEARLTATRAVAQHKEPVKISLAETVAQRSLPVNGDLPSLQKRLEGRR